MLPLLEERFDVLAVDLPGFGRSEPFPPSVDSTPEALADAVEDEMGRAGFDRAHLAGNSLGGNGSERPNPGRSTASTSNRCSSSGSIGLQPLQVWPIPWMRTSGSPDPPL